MCKRYRQNGALQPVKSLCKVIADPLISSIALIDVPRLNSNKPWWTPSQPMSCQPNSHVISTTQVHNKNTAIVTLVYRCSKSHAIIFYIQYYANFLNRDYSGKSDTMLVCTNRKWSHCSLGAEHWWPLRHDQWNYNFYEFLCGQPFAAQAALFGLLLFFSLVRNLGLFD